MSTKYPCANAARGEIFVSGIAESTLLFVCNHLMQEANLENNWGLHAFIRIYFPHSCHKHNVWWGTKQIYALLQKIDMLREKLIKSEWLFGKQSFCFSQIWQF